MQVLNNEVSVPQSSLHVADSEDPWRLAWELQRSPASAPWQQRLRKMSQKTYCCPRGRRNLPRMWLTMRMARHVCFVLRDLVVSQTGWKIWFLLIQLLCARGRFGWRVL